MNEGILYVLANISIGLAGFSGVVAVFRQGGARNWSPTERRILWLLIGDSFLVILFSLLPVLFFLANWSLDIIWGVCNALLGSWFIFVDVQAIRGEFRDRSTHQLTTVPVISPILYILSVVAIGIAIALWLSVFDTGVSRGQAIYVLGLVTLLAFGTLEFLFFIGLASRQNSENRGSKIKKEDS